MRHSIIAQMVSDRRWSHATGGGKGTGMRSSPASPTPSPDHANPPPYALTLLHSTEVEDDHMEISASYKQTFERSTKWLRASVD